MKIGDEVYIHGYIDEIRTDTVIIKNDGGYFGTVEPEVVLNQPEPCEDADKLKRCRFEYINACKTVTYPTPDTSKGDIHDAYAVIKALHPIFGDEDF